MIVEIKPLPSSRWHGKKGKESFTQPKVIEVLFNPDSGKYETGLSEEDAKKYGDMLGLDLSDTWVPEKEHPFWSTKAAQIKLENNTVFLDDSKPLQFIQIKNLKASKFVANSMKEWEAGKWPDATHVIFDETEEVTMKATKIQRKNKAIQLAAKLSLEEKANIILILTGKVVKNKSQDFIDVQLDQVLEDQVEEFTRYASMDTADTQVRASVLEAIHRNILNREGSAVYYMGERIGFDIQEAIEWFQSADNQKLKVAILEKLNG